MMPFILLFALLNLAIALVFIAARAKATCRVTQRRLSSPGPESLPAEAGCHIEPKPPWVHEEVIRLKALMPEYGCRKIAITFNVLHESRQKMTVGKSFVAGVVRCNKAEIRPKRRELKHRVPRPMPKNTIWTLDLTTVDDSPVLGVVDHGTRASLELSKLPDKTMLTILRSVIDLVERFGRPKIQRTDNEGMFASPFFGLIIKMFGVRHQRTMPKAPWQNGRIERFFGTLKAALRLRPDGPIDQDELRAFRAWYNRARPHHFRPLLCA